MRPFRSSGGHRQLPSAHQETEATTSRKDESEGGIHGEGWVSVSESTTLAVTVGRETDAERGAMNMKLKISGMSCGHCVSHVKSALEGIAGVSQADVSLENHEAEVTLSDQVNDADLFGAVEAAGYQAEAG